MSSNNLHSSLFNQQYFYEKINKFKPVCVADSKKPPPPIIPKSWYPGPCGIPSLEYWQDLWPMENYKGDVIILLPLFYYIICNFYLASGLISLPLWFIWFEEANGHSGEAHVVRNWRSPLPKKTARRWGGPLTDKLAKNISLQKIARSWVLPKTMWNWNLILLQSSLRCTPNSDWYLDCRFLRDLEA